MIERMAMPNISKANLMDKDIKALPVKEKKYIKACGNPKELYIWIYPSKKKTFSLLYDGHYYMIKEFREGIFSVADARKEAIKMLRDLENGKDPKEQKENEKYTFGALFERYAELKRKKGLVSVDKTIVNRCKKYLLPSLAKRDIKSIKYSELLDILSPIFNPNEPNESKLDTIGKLIGYINEIFQIALKDGYLETMPLISALRKEFPSKTIFYAKNDIEANQKAITDLNELKEFIYDLKCYNGELSTKRALYLQLLVPNRAGNTAEAKWADIDLENGIWHIRSSEMKMKDKHEIALSKQVIELLRQKKLLTCDKEFVFASSESKSGHLQRDTISKNIRTTLGGKVDGKKGKWYGRATPHGFRATFKTICKNNIAQLLPLGISSDTIKACLAHKVTDKVEQAYLRQLATTEQKKILMQWYADFLESIEPLGIL